MEEGGFEIAKTDKSSKRPQTGRGGRDGEGGRGRGRGEGRGRGRGDYGNRANDARPRTGVTRKDDQGNDVFDPEQKKGGRFEGKARDSHPFDKHSGRGRGTRNPGEKKGGAGRGNYGMRADRAHKQGREVGEDGVPSGPPPQKVGAAK